MKVFLRDILVTIVVALAVFLLLQFTLQSSIIVGSSMEPNFVDGQRLLVSKVAYYFRTPERGDVIIFTPPYSQQDDFIKRIIGLPGESIQIKEGTVYIHQGEKSFSLDEQAYIETRPGYSFEEQVIPTDNYFVLGDNRSNSNDSHHGWTVPREEIIGTAWLSIWPPDKWGLMPHYSPQEMP